jgi:hypothetical protein
VPRRGGGGGGGRDLLGGSVVDVMLVCMYGVFAVCMEKFFIDEISVLIHCTWIFLQDTGNDYDAPNRVYYRT